MKSILKIAIVIIAVIIICALALVFYANTHGHPEARISDLIPNAAKAVVQPWNVRAEAMIPKMFEGSNRQIVAQAIQGISHPTGKNPQMESVGVLPNGAGISVRFEVDWRGGFSSSAYKTVVVWECSQQNHARASVTGDTAPVGIDQANAQKLDDYFRTEIYPMLCKNLQ